MIISAIYQASDGTLSQNMYPNFKVMDINLCEHQKAGYQKIYEKMEIANPPAGGVLKGVLV